MILDSEHHAPNPSVKWSIFYSLVLRFKPMARHVGSWKRIMQMKCCHASLLLKVKLRSCVSDECNMVWNPGGVRW